MTRDEFIHYINKETEIPMTHIGATIENFTNWVVGAVEAGHDVKLQGFGSFKIKEKPKKRVVDPTTVKLPKDQRKMMETLGGKKVVFEPGARLTRAVEN